jgi:hypothetical protein
MVSLQGFHNESILTPAKWIGCAIHAIPPAFGAVCHPLVILKK